MIGGKKFTVDRSRIKRGSSQGQEHKLWAINGSGNWVKYPHSEKFNWTNRGDVKKSNRWREQTFERAGFPKKRKDKRREYTEKEKDYLRKVLKEFTRAQITKQIKKIMEDFNKAFPSAEPRTEAGITSMLERLRKELDAKSEKNPANDEAPSETGGDQGDDSEGNEESGHNDIDDHVP